MSTAKRIAVDAVGVGGLACVLCGLYQAWPPLAWVVGGAAGVAIWIRAVSR